MAVVGVRRIVAADGSGGAGKAKLEDLKVLWRDPAAHKAGAEAVRKAAECERQAVGEIQAALASIRSDVKAPEITQP